MTPGHRLADLVRTITRTDMVAYGAATWDWHRLHHDIAYARARGLDGPVVDGQMLGALLAEQVIRAFDGTPRFVRLHFRNRAPVFADDEIRCEGVVASVADGLVVIDQQILVADRVVVAPAGTEVVAPGAGAETEAADRRR